MDVKEKAKIAEETVEQLEKLDEFVQTIKGITREFGPFKAVVEDDLSVAVVSQNGWCIVYPPMSDTWALLVGWLKDWSDTDAQSMENFIKVVVYPASTRLIDIDKEYLADIVNAHVALTNRKVAESGSAEEQE